jgi:putative transposase
MMPQVRPDLCQRLTTEISEPGDKWYLDVVFIEINGSIHYLWRAVDQDGVVLDIMVQSRRDKRAAKKFFRKLLKRLRYVPRAIVTDKLKSYSAAKAEVMPSVAHYQQKYQNNRAENSHQPTRWRERLMRRFKSLGHGQRFLSAFGIINSHFRVGRHLYRASAYREVMRRDSILGKKLVGSSHNYLITESRKVVESILT